MLLPWARDVISIFSRGGQHFDPFFRGGGDKNKMLCAKAQKSLFLKIRGGRQMLPLPPPLK